MNTKSENRKNTKGISFRVKDELFTEMEMMREQLGVNWSFQLRNFLQSKVEQLKASKLDQIK